MSISGLRDYQLHLIDRIRSTARSETNSTHLGFEAGEQRWAVPLTEVSEVIPVPTLTSVPLTQDWFLGIASVRGCLYAITDFGRFARSIATPFTAECRLVLLHHRYGAHSALLVRRSLGLRQLLVASPPEGAASEWQSATLRDADGQVWCELGVKGLTASPRFLTAGLDGRTQAQSRQ